MILPSYYTFLILFKPVTFRDNALKSWNLVFPGISASISVCLHCIYRYCNEIKRNSCGVSLTVKYDKETGHDCAK